MLILVQHHHLILHQVQHIPQLAQVITQQVPVIVQHHLAIARILHLTGILTLLLRF